MKKLYILSFCLIATQASAQWIQVGTPFSGITRGLYFQSDEIGYAVSGNNGQVVPFLGYIAKTEDGGNTWTADTINGPNQFRAVYFLNNDTGFVCGAHAIGNPPTEQEGYILKTTDAGNSWTTILYDSGQYFRAVQFISSTTGFVSGVQGTILKTTDGGDTWTTYQLDQTTSDVIQLHMVDATLGYAVCSGSVSPFASGYVYKTTDGGDTWFQVYYNSGIGLLGLGVADDLNVFAGGTNELIVKTVDGGLNWDEVHTGLAGSIRSGFAISEDKIFMVDDASTVLSSIDAGATWNDTVLGFSGLYSIYFPTQTIGFAGDGGGVIYKIELGCLPLSELSAIEGPTSICNNQKQVYTATSLEGADNYNWTLPEGSSIVGGDGTDTIVVIFGENSGTVSVTASNNCDTTEMISIEVTVNVAPPVPTITFSNGILSSDAPQGNQWYFNGLPILNATDPDYEPTQNGTYYVVVSVADGCSTQSQPFDVIGVGIDALINTSAFTIFPNPMNQFTQINISAPNAERLIVSDIQGKSIISITLTSHQVGLSKKDLSQGVYIVQLMNDKNELISRRKLIVQ